MKEIPDMTDSAARSEGIQTAFNGLRRDTLDILDNFYSPGIHFEDPLGRIEGLTALKQYYANMYENVQEIRFEFSDEVIQEDTHVVFWTMYLRAKRLNGGEEIAVAGNSILQFGPENLVVYHRDYFDVGEMVYEHLPVLGFFVRQTKQRLGH